MEKGHKADHTGPRKLELGSLTNLYNYHTACVQSLGARVLGTRMTQPCGRASPVELRAVLFCLARRGPRAAQTRQHHQQQHLGMLNKGVRHLTISDPPQP